MRERERGDAECKEKKKRHTTGIFNGSYSMKQREEKEEKNHHATEQFFPA